MAHMLNSKIGKPGRSRGVHNPEIVGSNPTLAIQNSGIVERTLLPINDQSSKIFKKKAVM